MKRLASLAGSVLALLCLGFFVHTLAKHWSGLRDIAVGPQVYGGMAAALALYGATYLTGGKSWQLVLHSLGNQLDYRSSLGILTISQLAKYLPGNVGHHFGRVLLARRVGVDTDIAITSIGLDTMLAVSASVFCALGAAQFLPEISARYGIAVGRNLAVALVVGALAVSVALAFSVPRTHLTNATRRCRGLVARGNRLRSAMAWFQYLANFLLGATALGCISATLAPQALPAFSSLIGIYSIAWLIGFLIPGAPAGLGVREALLVLGLSPALGQDAATATTALFRVVTVAGDGMAFAIGYVTASPGIRRAGAIGVESERTK